MIITKCYPLYRVILCLVCSNFSLMGWAQEKHPVTAVAPIAKKQVTITGHILDSIAQKPAPFATVGLYRINNPEKPVQNTFTSNKGKYEFIKVDTGSYIVFASGSGFTEKQSLPFTITGETPIEIPAISLNTASQDLAAVTVSARKPLIEQSEDKLIYNAEADPSSVGQTAIDVLRKTPFISVDGENNVQLNGQGNFKLLLNGKETAMFTKNAKEALQSFPANLIKSIEVITTPSAKYDGEGVGGIINIITKKKVAGYNGSAGISQNTFGGINGNGNMSIKYGKLGLNASYGLNYLHSFHVRNESETESLNPVAFYKRRSDGTRTNHNFYNYGNLELSWDMDSLNTLSTYGSINGGRSGNTNIRDLGLILPNKTDTVHSHYIDNANYRYPSWNWGTDFMHKFSGNPGRELAFKMFHDYSHDKNILQSDQYNPGYEWYILNNNLSGNQQSTWQLDYVHPFKNKMKLEAGAKLIARNAYADYESSYRSSLHEDYTIDESNADNFTYKQWVYSSYASFSLNLGKYNFRLGTRFEQTKVEGAFKHSKTTVDQDYLTWLPSFMVSRKFNTIHTLSLSYTKRLSRPYIWDLNPFVNNTDSLNIYSGNPQLEPEIYHAAELGYLLVKGKTTINIRLSETFSNNQIVRYSTFNDNTGITNWNSDNLGNYSSTGLSGNISVYLTSKWRLSSNLGLRYDFIRNRQNSAQKNQGFGGYSNLNTSIDFTKKVSVYLTGNVSRSPALLQGFYGVNYSYNAGSNIKFLNNKLTLTININNFLMKDVNWHSEFNDKNFRTVSKNIRPARSANIGLRWNFGKLTENVSRKRGINNDDLKGNSN